VACTGMSGVGRAACDRSCNKLMLAFDTYLYLRFVLMITNTQACDQGSIWSPGGIRQVPAVHQLGGSASTASTTRSGAGSCFHLRSKYLGLLHHVLQGLTCAHHTRCIPTPAMTELQRSVSTAIAFFISRAFKNAGLRQSMDPYGQAHEPRRSNRDVSTRLGLIGSDL
jgi:hypothetical protein